MKRNFLLKTMMLIASCLFGVGQSWATETEIVKSWDFAIIGNNHSDKTTFYSLSDGTINAGGTSCDLGTGDLAGLFVQGGDKWYIYKKGYLYNGNGGGRIFGLTNLKAGDIVTIKMDGEYFTSIRNATYTYADKVYTLTVASDGIVYGKSDPRYHSIYSVTVEREKTEKPLEPTGYISAVNGVNRTVTLSTETPDCAIYYTTDGTTPTIESDFYSSGVEISSNTTIKAIAVREGVSSDVYSGVFTAGFTITLATPNYSVSAMNAFGSVYYGTYAASCDNSEVLCNPTSSLSAKFNGSSVALPYAASEAGTLEITATAAGYEPSSLFVDVKPYAKTLSYDFKSLTADDLNSDEWGEVISGSLADKWTSMNESTEHFVVQNDEALSTVFPGLTLGKLKTDMPTLYIGYGIIWNSIVANYGAITITSGTGNEIIGVTTNGSYGKNKSTWYTLGKTVYIYRFDTALEDLNVYVPIENETLTINPYGWASYAPSVKVAVPAGVDVYYVSAQNGTYATLAKLDAGTTVAANTGLLVNSEAETVTFNASAATPATISGNLLSGTQETIAKPATGTVYVLGNGTKGVGLYKYGGETLAAGKAYMYVAGAEAPKCILFDNDATGISNATVENVQNGVIYNLAGQKVSANYKGVVIVNGKKMVK